MHASDLQIPFSFSGITPTTADQQHWSGYLTDKKAGGLGAAGGSGSQHGAPEFEYYVECGYDAPVSKTKSRVTNPFTLATSPLYLRIDTALHALLQQSSASSKPSSHYLHLLQQRTKQCTTLYELLHELHTLVQQLHAVSAQQQRLHRTSHAGQQRSGQLDSAAFDSTYAQVIVQDLHTIGWPHVTAIDSTLQHLQLTLTDGGQRKHKMDVTLSNDYPQTPPIITIDLPLQPSITPAATPMRLPAFLQHYVQTINKLQDFWQCMDDIDKHTWVLEPSSDETHNHSILYRRIAISRGLSIIASCTDPLQPRTAVWKLQPMGSEQHVSDLHQKWSRNLHQWTTQLLPRENIQRLLEIEHFPTPEIATVATDASNTMVDDLNMECTICYTYNLDGSTPDVVCSNQQCLHSYHHSCLLQWFQGLTSTITTFNTMFGNCMNCEKQMSINIEQDGTAAG